MINNLFKISGTVVEGEVVKTCVFFSLVRRTERNSAVFVDECHLCCCTICPDDGGNKLI
jgi:hypothetical protein